jgi:DNA-binding FadR family transcriptional regulator
VPDRNYYEELIEVRLMIECHAARQGAPRKVCSALDAMEQAVRAMEQLQVGPRYNDYRLFNSWDTKFHQALVESAGNRVLTQAYADLHVHLHVSRLYVLLGGIDTSKAVEDHIRILTAFRDGDPDASEAAVRRHLENARRRLLVNDELTASAKSEETTER